MPITFVDSLANISQRDWQALNCSNSPFLSYDFFHALEKSQSATAEQGWQPHHMVVSQRAESLKHASSNISPAINVDDNSDAKTNVTAILPLYLKSHSWGEYVFDWSWAQAYDDHNIPYYPKLVGTIPFTPVTSPKLLGDLTLHDTFSLLSEHCQQHNIHSWHLLFCQQNQVTQSDANTAEALPDDVYLRHTVQFNWFNRDYTSFDDFLSRFNARKRKNTRKERASIAQKNITIKRVNGADITEQQLEFFYLSYQLTYLKKGHQPHLSLAFFQQVLSSLADNILLVIASRDQVANENNKNNVEVENIACALFFFDDTHLYGRYWGCTEPIKNLHFELCYYQGIEFCIEHKLQCFNPGTQGEHKIQRGFEPVLTHSYHWVKHPSFQPSIKDFCQREREHMQVYLQQCQQALPFAQVAGS
ncbi:GNAT family N-acetyltransferase [Colwellia asteriadis]|uniref:GNAT family N-acetyltransferase n=1 Tax=Colwellia asteriadis TaxID=517723 RepID=A0ABP3WJP8_9GAMM